MTGFTVLVALLVPLIVFGRFFCELYLRLQAPWEMCFSSEMLSGATPEVTRVPDKVEDVCDTSNYLVLVALLAEVLSWCWFDHQLRLPLDCLPGPCRPLAREHGDGQSSFSC